jgi:hypothetical protein
MKGDTPISKHYSQRIDMSVKWYSSAGLFNSTNQH